MRYASLPASQLQAWAQFNGVTFNNICVAENVTSKDGVDKGSGLLATGFSESSASMEVLLTIPSDLVLSKEAVHLCAKADLDLKEILDAVGDFAEVGHIPREYAMRSTSSPPPARRLSLHA